MKRKIIKISLNFFSKFITGDKKVRKMIVERSKSKFRGIFYYHSAISIFKKILTKEYTFEEGLNYAKEYKYKKEIYREKTLLALNSLKTMKETLLTYTNGYKIVKNKEKPELKHKNFRINISPDLKLINDFNKTIGYIKFIFTDIPIKNPEYITSTFKNSFEDCENIKNDYLIIYDVLDNKLYMPQLDTTSNEYKKIRETIYDGMDEYIKIWKENE